jgi:predicted lipoprotein
MNPSRQVEAHEKASRNAPRRIAVAVVILVAVILFALKPPFVIRPLPGAAVVGSGAQHVESAAARFVDPIWESKVLPAIQEKAQDIAKILPEVRADPSAAGEKYGRRDPPNPFNYMVKGTGKVVELHTESVAGTVDVEIPGLTEKVVLQIGPVVRGTSLRDATGHVSFNQFTNQLDYADVSKEMNTRALKTAFSKIQPASLAGKTITFFGTFAFDPHSKGPILITPVKIDL